MTQELESLAKRLKASGMKPLDALHLASASISKADYFCTCDDKFLKKASHRRILLLLYIFFLHVRIEFFCTIWTYTMAEYSF